MNFDRIAPFYDGMENLAAGKRLHRCRIEYLGEIDSPKRILLVGEGHGRFLRPCREKFPNAEIVVIDGSAKMLEIARRKLRSAEGVSFIHSMIGDWNYAGGKFDLIVTNFMLDCLTASEMAPTIQKLAELASPTADWLIADFEIARKGIARWRSYVIVRLLYQFFRVVSQLPASRLIAPNPYLEQSGFTLKKRRVWEWGLLKSEWWYRKI